ncbi:MAG TPA: thioredoxin domain-containing protein [Acidisarcina sp.]|nr:thioredoxin domain-containing protein [Acidisarcina sp.]
MSLFARVRRYALVSLPVMAVFFLLATTGFAQFSNPTPVGDKSALRPPAGARVALYVFEDLECPDCSRAYPLLTEAAEKYKIPLLIHDFPLPFHAWSFDAAVNARWFDTKGKKTGDEYRAAVYASQPSIHTPGDLRSFTEKFAAQHQIQLPFVVDPQKKLSDAVKADYALGQRIGIEHTPTIWVVTNKTNGVPFVEVVDRSKLYEMIDKALAETKSPAAPAKNRVVKASTKK